MKLLVIGAGAMGAAASAELARRGHEVDLVDAKDIPNPDAASYGDTRVYRTAYFESSSYVALAKRAIELWGRLEERHGVQLLCRTGVLYFGPSDTPLMEGVRVAGAMPGVILQDGREKARSWSLPVDWEVLWEESGGAVYASLAYEHLLADCQHLGVNVIPNRVVDPSGLNNYDQTLLACGVGAAQYVQTLPLRMIPMETHVFQTAQRSAVDPSAFPVFACQPNPDDFLYGFPDLPIQGGFKAASHTSSAEQSTLPEVTGFLSERLKGLEFDHHTTRSCQYDQTPDGHFLMGQIGEKLWALTGFSGHGFKFTPALAEGIADLMEAKQRPDLEFLRPGRF